MNPPDAETVIVSPASAPLWQTIFLGPVGAALLAAVLAALLGGILGPTILNRVTRSREQRAHRRELSVDLMRCAYGFYQPLEELRRRNEYGQEVLPKMISKLTDDFLAFRVDARILESKLEIEYPSIKDEARWLWHGAIDTLTARYYVASHQPQARIDDLTTYHGDHRSRDDIPGCVRGKLPTKDQLVQVGGKEDANRKAFEKLLNQLFITMRGQKDDGPAILPHR